MVGIAEVRAYILGALNRHYYAPNHFLCGRARQHIFPRQSSRSPVTSAAFYLMGLRQESYRFPLYVIERVRTS